MELEAMLEAVIKRIWTADRVQDQSFGVLKHGVRTQFVNYDEGRFLKIWARRDPDYVATWVSTADFDTKNPRDVATTVDSSVRRLTIFAASPWLDPDSLDPHPDPKDTWTPQLPTTTAPRTADETAAAPSRGSADPW